MISQKGKKFLLFKIEPKIFENYFYFDSHDYYNDHQVL
jgi:hypothetical protein